MHILRDSKLKSNAMEFMGLHLPGASFVPPNTPLRTALTELATKRALDITSLGKNFTPAYKILDEKAFVNGIVGLMATGGSTNLVLHCPQWLKLRELTRTK